MIVALFSPGAEMPVSSGMPSFAKRRRLSLQLLILCAAPLASSAGARAASSDDHFAEAERAHYAALCRAHRSLDACSDAVRWSPGDPVLVAALADALVRAGRVPEAIRDYRRAEALDPHMRGLDTKIAAAEAKLSGARHARKSAAAETAAAERAAAEPAAVKHYSNADPETQSH